MPLFAICGELDLMATENREEVAEQLISALDKGATNVGPPADMYPPAKIENIEYFVEVLNRYKGRGK
jgi:hypothetical protein